MPHRPSDPRDDRPWRDNRESHGEEGRFSSDQARYFGADNRSYGDYPGSRSHAEPPSWRRGRYEAGGRAIPDLPVDHEDALTRGYYSLEGPHEGQEYGIEPHGYRASLPREYAERHGRRDRRQARYDNAPYDDQPLPRGDAGVREFGPPADYAYHPHADAGFEPDYLDWREEQLAGHDRDYAAWRAEQHRKYDDEYRVFRCERRSEFGRSFADWRAQQDPLSAPASEGARDED